MIRMLVFGLSDFDPDRVFEVRWYLRMGVRRIGLLIFCEMRDDSPSAKDESFELLVMNDPERTLNDLSDSAEGSLHS